MKEFEKCVHIPVQKIKPMGINPPVPPVPPTKRVYDEQSEKLTTMAVYMTVVAVVIYQLHKVFLNYRARTAKGKAKKKAKEVKPSTCDNNQRSYIPVLLIMFVISTFYLLLFFWGPLWEWHGVNLKVNLKSNKISEMGTPPNNMDLNIAARTSHESSTPVQQVQPDLVPAMTNRDQAMKLIQNLKQKFQISVKPHLINMRKNELLETKVKLKELAEYYLNHLVEEAKELRYKEKELLTLISEAEILEKQVINTRREFFEEEVEFELPDAVRHKLLTSFWNVFANEENFYKIYSLLLKEFGEYYLDDGTFDMGKLNGLSNRDVILKMYATFDQLFQYIGFNPNDVFSILPPKIFNKWRGKVHEAIEFGKITAKLANIQKDIIFKQEIYLNRAKVIVTKTKNAEIELRNLKIELQKIEILTSAANHVIDDSIFDKTFQTNIGLSFQCPQINHLNSLHQHAVYEACKQDERFKNIRVDYKKCFEQKFPHIDRHRFSNICFDEEYKDRWLACLCDLKTNTKSFCLAKFECEEFVSPDDRFVKVGHSSLDCLGNITKFDTMLEQLPQISTHHPASSCHQYQLEFDLYSRRGNLQKGLYDMMSQLQSRFMSTREMLSVDQDPLSLVVKENAKMFIEVYIGHLLVLCGFGLMGDFKEDYIGWICTLVFVFTLAKFIFSNIIPVLAIVVSFLVLFNSMFKKQCSVAVKTLYKVTMLQMLFYLSFSTKYLHFQFDVFAIYGIYLTISVASVTWVLPDILKFLLMKLEGPKKDKRKNKYQQQRSIISANRYQNQIPRPTNSSWLDTQNKTFNLEHKKYCNNNEKTINNEEEIICALRCTSGKTTSSFGYIEVICSEKCSLSYHSSCWRKYLKQMKLNAAKSLLRMSCCTSDCWGMVTKILWKDKFGNEIKELVQEEIDKDDKVIKVNKVQTHSKKYSRKISKTTPKKHSNRDNNDDERTNSETNNFESSNNKNYSDSHCYTSDVKMVIKNNKTPKIEDQTVSKKRKPKQKHRLTMSLGEYQNSFLGQCVRTDLQFTNFTSVLIDIKRKHHLTHVKAKDLLVAAVGMSRYVPTKHLDAIYSRVEEELIQEQEAIQEDIHKQEKVPDSSSSHCIAQYDDPEIEECSICCDEILDDKEVLVPCGHEYHNACIRLWFREKAECPLCREHIKLIDEFPKL